MIEKNETIEIRILQLLDSEDKWWTIEEISNQLFLSKATTQKYTTLLKLRCARFPEEQIFLEKSPSKGIFLHRSPIFALQFIYTQVIKELLVFSVLDTFFNKKSNQLLKIAMDNFSSVASIRRKYQTINQRFIELGLDISIVKDNIIGNERQIRWFYSKFYWRIFRGTEWPFHNLSKNMVEHRLKIIQDFYKIELSTEVKEEMLYWLAINWWRHLQGYRVEPDKEIQEYCLDNPFFEIFTEATNQAFPKSLRQKEPSNKYQVQYLYFLINSLPLLENNNKYNEQIYNSHKKANTIIYRMTQEWFLHFEIIFDIIIPSNIRYYIEIQLLRIHSYSYLFKPKPYIIFEDYEKENKEAHPKFKNTLLNLYGKLNINYREVTENKDYILEHYTYLIQTLIDINVFEKNIRVCLSFSKGDMYEKIAQKKILSRFGDLYNLNFVPNEVENDILITDHPCSEPLNSYSLLRANYKLTERDFNQLERSFQLILNYKNT